MGGSSSKPTTTTSSATSQADNRTVLGNGAATVGAFGSYASNSNNRTSNQTSFEVNDSSSHDLSTHTNFEETANYAYTDSSQRNLTNNIADSSQRNTSTSLTDARNLADSSQRNDSSQRYSDSSDRSTNNYSFTGTDGGAVDIARMNSQLLRSVSTNQGDTVRLIAQMGADGVQRQAQAATDLFATGSKQNAEAWGHTVDASASLIDRLMQTAQSTVAGATAVASQTVANAQPVAGKQADAFKYAAIAGAAIAAIHFLKA